MYVNKSNRKTIKFCFYPKNIFNYLKDLNFEILLDTFVYFNVDVTTNLKFEFGCSFKLIQFKKSKMRFK